jgi:hypothetical protein
MLAIGELDNGVLGWVALSSAIGLAANEVVV